jgi:L-lactate dehydrogenase (cytochrome)
MLPRVVDAAGDKTEILVDGGVRNGQDVMRAVASGAKAALIGRPWIWAVAARGEDGLRALLKTFLAELKVSMALTACTSIDELTPDILEPREPG